MDTELTLVHERVDDIPVTFGMGRRLGLAAVLDKHLGRHGNHHGLSYGWLATTWIAYILAEGDHRKSAVEGWSQKHKGLLTLLTGQGIRATEFSDDRLGRLLSQLGDPATWQAIEKDLWQQTVLAYDLRCERVRLDSTTTYGFHETSPDGLMQLGHSKDHRPDKPQMKLMAAVAEPAQQLLAATVYPGQTADDGLYVPMIERVREITRKPGLLYIGDAKMAALATRAAIVRGKDHYLTRLPCSGDAAQRDGWITAVIEDGQATTEIARDGQPLGEGYEIARTLTHRDQSWTERVLIYRSTALVERHQATFDERLAKAADALRALTPSPGPGRRQLCDQKLFLAAIARIEAKYDVSGLFWVKWNRKSHPSRKEPNRERFVVLDVIQRPECIAPRRQRLGWQVLVTDVSSDELPFSDVVLAYNDGWVIEHQFHGIKDRPLGIRPLFVTSDDQIIGLTHLITLALRILTLITSTVRRSLKRTGETLIGLFEGQRVRATDRPTGRRLLKTFYRAEVTLTRIRGPNQDLYHLTPLPPLLSSILRHLGLSDATYTDLTKSPAQ
jgi:transposase